MSIYIYVTMYPASFLSLWLVAWWRGHIDHAIGGGELVEWSVQRDLKVCFQQCLWEIIQFLTRLVIIRPLLLFRVWNKTKGQTVCLFRGYAPVYLIWIVHVPYSFIYACWYTACDPVYRCGIVPHNWLFVHLCLLWTGSLFHTRCTECGHVEENTKSPLCPALKGKGYTVQIFCMHMVLSNLSSS